MKRLPLSIVIILALSPDPASIIVIGQDRDGQTRSTRTALRYSLLDADGKRHSVSEWAHSRAAVFLFIATECPISNRYAPEVNRIVGDYASKGFSFFAVQSDPDVTPDAARKHSQEFEYKFPVLLDPEQTLATSLGVVATPTAIIVSHGGDILYRGRIDNRYIDLGKYRDAGVEPDLRRALDAVAAGQPIAEPFTRTIGCALPPPGKRSANRHQHK